MKKTILRNITVIAIAILTTFGAASCKKEDTTTTSTFEYEYSNGTITFSGDGKNYTYNVSDIGGAAFLRYDKVTGTLAKGDHCIALNFESSGSNAKGIGFNYYNPSNTAIGTVINISAADINNDLLGFGFGNPTTFNQNFYTLKSGSITFTIINSDECKGTLSGTFTKGNGSTTTSGTATFDLKK